MTFARVVRKVYSKFEVSHTNPTSHRSGSLIDRTQFIGNCNVGATPTWITIKLDTANHTCYFLLKSSSSFN